MEKLQNQKLLTIVHKSLKLMDCFVKEFLVLQKIMNVIVVNIKRFVFKVLNVKNVVLK